MVLLVRWSGGSAAHVCFPPQTTWFLFDRFPWLGDDKPENVSIA